MAQIRITNQKDGNHRIVEDTESTRKAIKGHNHYAKEGQKWIVSDPDEPAPLTEAQKIASIAAENAQLKAELEMYKNSSIIPPVEPLADDKYSKDYEPDHAILLINMYTNAEELIAFCKNEKRVAVKEARDKKLATLKV